MPYGTELFYTAELHCAACGLKKLIRDIGVNSGIIQGRSLNLAKMFSGTTCMRCGSERFVADNSPPEETPPQPPIGWTRIPEE